ncbi:SPFH domain-containing protein [Mycoplasmopsis verecunda]|uniref:Regulator of protease activity HflC, stomatin/prohibitin superfamily n=1 Tax=Mycoplasmopsis verecunda TaxID=171291 RepID=A0A1T4KY97_9BACT|nr:SPFH domain-containing protein [Mycoplasmopsis verecunda]WPB54347.1 SPFH domain-containing protein [Mycoplasmopsis verecunda]SJZ47424.1 Regulator of protease activity HflC, stomatin/prohibitin superfamily [Mycoplasmopsis verecunda]
MSGGTIAGIVIGSIFGVIFLGLLIAAIVKSIVIVPETNFVIIQRFGKYRKTLHKGLHFIVPFIDEKALVENFKEKVMDFPAQSVITKDNATIKVDTVVYLKIVDAQLFAYGAERPYLAIESLTATTLRNLIGEIELDESLTSREIINAKLTKILDIASDPWGIKVNRIEIQDIIPPREVQEAMIRQMQAERNKRANILEAEGIRQSQILKAQGEKESTILNAEASKQQKILEAEAERQKRILEAQGEKEAIELINSAGINESFLRLKSIQEWTTIANGTATKIILPPNLADVASVVAAGTEVFKSMDDKKRK